MPNIGEAVVFGSVFEIHSGRRSLTEAIFDVFQVSSIEFFDYDETGCRVSDPEPIQRLIYPGRTSALSWRIEGAGMSDSSGIGSR